MKKLIAMTALAVTFAVVAGTAAPKDLPFPQCLPCSPGSSPSSLSK